MSRIVLFASGRTKHRLSSCVLRPIVSQYSNVQNGGSSGYIYVKDRRRPAKWPNKSLGPIDTLDPRFPLPGNIGIDADSRSKFEKTVSSTDGYVSAVNSLPLLPEDHYLGVLTQTFASIEFSESTEKIRPLISEVPQVLELKAPETVSYNLHRCPHLLRFALTKYYPHLPNTMDLTTITHAYKTDNSNNHYSPEMANERSIIAEQFIAKAIELCAALKDMKYWADFINPYTGKPYLAPHHREQTEAEVITETHPAMEQLGFEIDELGCCKVVRHRIWGSNIFIGLIFTDAPRHHPLLTEFDNSGDL